MADRSDAQLIATCLSGDADAFEPLVERYQNFALALALGRIANYHDAQEIVQEAFVKAYCKLVQLKDRDGFAGWFRSIVLNGCYTWLTRQNRHPVSSFGAIESDELAGPSMEAHRDATVTTSVWDAVHTLPEKYRTVVLLHYMNDYSYHEISGLLGLPVTTVKGRLQQARLKLKREFLPEEKETLKMKRTDKQFTKGVQAQITQIATKPIKEEISLGDTDHLVLFCGIYRNDIEVRQHEKEAVEITGTRYSVGHGKADAERRVSGIQIYVDTVENYWEDGPHSIERFAGSLSDTEAAFDSGAKVWQDYKKRLAELEGPLAIPDRLRKVTRVTVGREKGEDILVPQDEFKGDIERFYGPNRWSEKGLHGPPGYMNLVISLPPGKCLTVIDGEDVKLDNLRNDEISLATVSRRLTISRASSVCWGATSLPRRTSKAN